MVGRASVARLSFPARFCLETREKMKSRNML